MSPGMKFPEACLSCGTTDDGAAELACDRWEYLKTIEKVSSAEIKRKAAKRCRERWVTDRLIGISAISPYEIGSILILTISRSLFLERAGISSERQQATAHAGGTRGRIYSK